MDVASFADSLWKVVAVGLVLGAGLPMVFALGLRSLTVGTTADASGHTAGTPSTAGRAGALVCFGVVVAAILYGIYYLWSGGH